jgi:hypothetical protein
VDRIKNLIDKQTLQKLRMEPGKMHNEYKEKCFKALAIEVLPSCFVAAVAIPDIILDKGHGSTDFAFQVIVSLFLKPIMEMHRRIGMEGFHLRASKVEEKKPSFLRAVKRALKGYFPKRGTTSMSFCEEGTTDEILVNMAHLLAWGVGAHYNSKNSKWISMLDIDVNKAGYGSSHLEEP